MYYDNTMSYKTEHQKCIDLTIAYFRERGVTCEDYEAQVGHEASKRPDLILPDFATLLEVKTFTPQEKELQEAQRLSQDFVAGKVSAYWHPDFFDRFGDDLRHSRQKFREYPGYHTAVIFYDLHSIFHQQSPEDLLLGQESWEIGFLENDPRQPSLVGYERKKRQLRRDKSNDIGAVAFHTGRNAFKVFHNHFADPKRRINPDIFALTEDQHFVYRDDRINPQIIPLKLK